MAAAINDQQTASTIVMDFYPEMAIKMIQEWSPNKVLKKIEDDLNNKFMTFLNYSEKKLIKTLKTDGFNKLDITLLYKLIRYFNLVIEPSKKWGAKPSVTDINHGDDMERMRINRNHLLHRPKGGLSKEKTDKIFNESIEIARRMDNFSRESTISFETRIRNAKINHITQEKHRQTEEEFVKLQQQLKISEINYVDLYYGNDIVVKLGQRDLPATESDRFILNCNLPNVNVPAIIEQLQQMIKKLNEEAYEIKLLEAESGSLVLHVEINNLCFKTKDSLHKAIAEFLHRVFTSISGSLDQHIMEVVLAECDSYIISDSSPSGTPENNKIDPDQLKLIEEDEDNKLPWNEAEEFTKEGAQAGTISLIHIHMEKMDYHAQQMSSLAMNEEEPDVKTATIEFRKMKLEEEGLHFRGSIPDDGNSFFEACSDQLQRLEIPGHTHTELRQMVIKNLKLCSENEIKSANFTSDTWEVYIDNVAKNKGNVEDIVVETMAKLLQKQIIVYSKSYKNEISRKNFNEEANGEPILLAKDNLYYQSLERRHDITPSRLQESNTSKIAESPPLLDDNASSSKLQSMPQEDQRFRTSTSSPVQGTSHEKNLEEANVSEVEREKGPNEEKIRIARKNMTTDERKLILLCYKKLAIANSWDKLAEEVYEKRNQHLSREMVRHYEDLYAKSKLKNRITSFIQRVKGDTVGNETDQEVIALMKGVREMQ